MDADRFELILRSLSRPRTRRGALATLLAGLLGSLAPAAGEGKRGRGKGPTDGKNRRDGKRQAAKPNRNRTQAEAACYTGTNCTPGPGKNLSRCDYSGSSTLQGKNLKGANLGSANLADADASGANLTGANLGKACLVGADLTGARFNGSTNLGDAVFCRTTMPDGSVNDSGCTKGNRCCETCIDQGQVCGPAIGGECCDGATCIHGACAEAPPCDICPNGCPFDNLQDAVDAADDDGTIRICPGTYRTIDVLIEKNLTIIGSGDGAGGTILDGERQARVLRIGRLVLVTIRDSTVTRGGVIGFGSGGGIFGGVSASLTLERVQVTDNANGLLGGGITVTEGSTLALRQSRVTNNIVDIEGSGAGIYSQGTVTLDASRVEDNVVPDGPGGGIFNTDTGIVSLTNGSTITGNTAERGGGIFNQGQVTLSGGSAITGNTPDDCFQTMSGDGLSGLIPAMPDERRRGAPPRLRSAVEGDRARRPSTLVAATPHVETVPI